MNDLQSLHAALAQDDPSQDVVDRSRHRLQNRITGGGPDLRRRTRWLAVGIGFTATAAAAAVAIAVLPTGNAGHPDNGAQPRTGTGQEVLLAAATAAERAPETSGQYWHVKVTTSGPDRETDTWHYYTGLDGRTWFAGAKTGGKAVESVASRQSQTPFDLFGAHLTLEQLRALPTDPAALKAWLRDAIANGDGRSSAGPLRDTPELFEQAQFDSLISLVSTLPAPPRVRAAAFRALASYPGVRSLGDVPGGQGLLLPGDQRFVVDTATGRVTGASMFVTPDGGIAGVDKPGSAALTAEWTNTLPQ
jgi:hypothetical protein